MACTPTSEFNITQLSLHSDPLFLAASVLLAGAGVRPNGLNLDESGVSTIWTARGLIVSGSMLYGLRIEFEA